MITPGQIDEWLREIQSRQESAAEIVRAIAARLIELDEKNEVLQAENILLRSGKKVEEFEGKIAALTTQLELLKRQFEGIEPAAQPPDRLSLMAFLPSGMVLRCPIAESDLVNRALLATFNQSRLADDVPVLQVVNSQEELVFVFDSGRAVTYPAEKINIGGRELDWEQASVLERRGNEQLAFVMPVGKLPLFDFGVQVSRRAFVRILKAASLSMWIARSNVGTGVIQPADRTFTMLLARKDERLVIVSREGSVWNRTVGELPYTPEEALRLSATDHITSAFAVSDQSDLLVVTQNGKIFHRELDWLEPAHAYKVQGQAVLSRSRLDAGTRIVAAAAANTDDWAVILTGNGQVTLRPVADLLDAGSVLDSEASSGLLAFCVFQV